MTSNTDQNKTVQRPLVMPDVFSDSGSSVWAQYIQHFEACAELNEWDDCLKCKYLAILLKDQAANIFFDLDDDVKKNWNVLKAALATRLDKSTSPEFAKSEFLSRSRKPDESVVDYGNAIRHLARNAYPKLTNEIRDELARDQFLRGLGGREMTIRVRQSKPSNLDEAITNALEYESICIDVANTSSGESTNVIAAATSKSERLEDMLTEMLILLKNKSLQPEVEMAENRRVQNQFSTQRGTKTCWECGSSGHIRNKCPRISNGRSRVCWNCGIEGHLRSECTISGNDHRLERRDHL